VTPVAIPRVSVTIDVSMLDSMRARVRTAIAEARTDVLPPGFYPLACGLSVPTSDQSLEWLRGAMVTYDGHSFLLRSPENL